MSLRVEIDVSGVVKAEKTIDRSTDRMKRQFRQLNNSTLLVEKAIKDLQASMSSSTNKMEKDVKQFSSTSQRELKKTASTFDGFFKTVKAAAVGYATVLATMTLTDFISQTFEAGVAIDALEKSMLAITGSTALANHELQFINNTAKTLGLGLSELENSYKDILAASKNTSLEGQGVRDIFTAISKASAVLGMSADDTKGSLRALSQMISKGNVQAEELRGQLGERLPGAFSMAAEAMGVTTEKLNDMLENGEVLATELLPNLARVLEKRFGPGAEEASERARFAFNNLGNAVLELQRTLMKSGVLEYLADSAKAATIVVDATNKLIKGATSQEQLDLTQQQIENIERQKQALQEAGRVYGEVEKKSSGFFDRINEGLAKSKAQHEGLLKPVEEHAKKIKETGDAYGQLNKELLKLKEIESIQKGTISTEIQFDHLSKLKIANDEFAKQQAILAKAEAEKQAKILKEKQDLQTIELKFIQELFEAEIKANNALFEKEKADLEEIQSWKEKASKVGFEKEAKSFKDAMNAMRSLKGVTEAERKAEKIISEEDLTPLDEYIKKLQDGSFAAEAMSNLTVEAFESMGNALTDFIMTGEMDFKSLGRTVIKELTDIMIQMLIMKPIMDALFGSNGSGGWIDTAISGIGNMFASEHGNVVSGSNISQFSNSVVSSPTIFPNTTLTPYATGGALAGEAGPEGILPLTRIGGDLGVKADMSGSKQDIFINVENNVADKAGTEVTTSTDDMGNTVIGIVVDAALRNKGGLGNVIKGVATKK